MRTLDFPVSLDADDQALLHQVIDYYHATLKQSPDALSYLEQRGIGSVEAIEMREDVCDYDADRSGLAGMQSVSGRAEVGSRSAGSRPPEIADLAAREAAFQAFHAETAENAKGRENPDVLPVVAETGIVATATAPVGPSLIPSTAPTTHAVSPA